MKVRVNSIYTYVPVMLDAASRHLQNIEKGLWVRVIKLRGCPAANVMGMCYVQSAITKEFIGMVCCNSLEPLTAKEKKIFSKQNA